MNPRDLWSRFKARAFVLESLATHRERCGGERGLRRVLNAFDLLMFGIGGIVGAGVFVLTGEAAQKYAGWARACKEGSLKRSWPYTPSVLVYSVSFDLKAIYWMMLFSRSSRGPEVLILLWHHILEAAVLLLPGSVQSVSQKSCKMLSLLLPLECTDPGNQRVLRLLKRAWPASRQNASLGTRQSAFSEVLCSPSVNITHLS